MFIVTVHMKDTIAEALDLDRFAFGFDSLEDALNVSDDLDVSGIAHTIYRVFDYSSDTMANLINMGVKYAQ